MAEAKRSAGHAHEAETEDASDTAAPDQAEHAPQTCPVAWCPVCLAVTTVQPIRPEVVEHLLKSGAEFLMAIKAVIDNRADSLSGEPSKNGHKAQLEKIDIG
jgi:hypothetical protein